MQIGVGKLANPLPQSPGVKLPTDIGISAASFLMHNRFMCMGLHVHGIASFV